MVRPGNTVVHHSVLMYAYLSCIVSPHVDIFTSPNLRKLMTTSVRMFPAMRRVAVTMTGVSMFGMTWRSIILLLLTPSARDAWMYSSSLTVSISPLTMNAMVDRALPCP